jgi:RNA binding exosome subunit
MSSSTENEPEIKIRQIELRTHVHATESAEKVSNVLLNLVSDEITAKNFIYEKLKGTFGQRITNIKLLIKKQAHITLFLEYIAQSLSDNDKSKLIGNFDKRFDAKNKFYFRLDKQLASFGKIALAEKADVIQVIIANFKMQSKKKLEFDHIFQYYKKLYLI